MKNFWRDIIEEALEGHNVLWPDELIDSMAKAVESAHSAEIKKLRGELYICKEIIESQKYKLKLRGTHG